MAVTSKRRWPWQIGLPCLLLLFALAFHFEKASRFERQTLAPPSSPLVLDSRDRILRLGADAQGRRVILLPDGPVPELVAAAFLAAEDARFRQHGGIDPRAIIRAAWSNLQAGRVVSGASTITQQLARLACPAPRTYYHKFVEMLRSLRIEAALSKDDILRNYLNLTPQGNNLMGVETAARLYFGKPAASLTAPEAATLAALAKAPGRLNPCGPNRQRLVQRRNWVLARMAQLGLLTAPESHAARQTSLNLRPGSLFPFEAPHFVNLVRAEGDPASPAIIRTTLDLTLQRRAQATIVSHRTRLHKVGVSQAAAVIIKNRPMEVIAMVGSFQYGDRDQGFNNGAAARRSPGSTLKPFLYAQALDLGHNPALVLEDVDGRYRTPGGEFIPANFDRVAHGPISLREALGNSLNLSSVYLLNQVGPPAFYDLLARLQLINHPERPAEHYGLGLVVGNPEVSLLQLATAFACLANGGGYRPATFVKGKSEAAQPDQIFSPQAAYIISHILADPMARARTFGASLAMNPEVPLAIKTGTSTRYRDCWAVGYTPEYTLAVWTGNFDGRPTARMSGAAAAAPILADLAAVVLHPNRSPGFTPPSGITHLEVCSFSGLRPGPSCQHCRQELFITGTEPREVCTYHQSQEPWHRVPTRFAGWLHQRHEHHGAGRFRLQDFDTDLDRTFGEPYPAESLAQNSELGTQDTNRMKGASDQSSGNHAAPGIKSSLGHNPAVHLHRTLFPALAANREARVTITTPLPGDRFLLPTGHDSVTLSLKAACRSPFPQITWFVDGREYVASGPPYEVSVPLSRGNHRLTVIGPDGLGDNVEIRVE